MAGYRDVTPTGFNCRVPRVSTEMSPLRGSIVGAPRFYRDVTPTGFRCIHIIHIGADMYKNR